MPDVGTTVFTDGACSGNPGPGGWAWVEPEGEWASGFDPTTTNQRMELEAVLRACEHFDGPLHIVSDSTYVVNCWRDGWWKGWLKRDWRNSRKEPVANRDLWEQVVPHFRDRTASGSGGTASGSGGTASGSDRTASGSGRTASGSGGTASGSGGTASGSGGTASGSGGGALSLEWVKGHSGNRWNDVADRLAVGAVQRCAGASGRGDPPADVLGTADGYGTPSGGRADPVPDAPGTVGGSDGPPVAGAADPRSGSVSRSALRRVSDPRVPTGHLLVVTGLRDRSLESDTGVGDLARVLSAHAEMHPDLVLLSGLRRGAETAAVAAAERTELPYAVVLPYPDPTAGWPESDASEFRRRLERASEVVVLEKKRPSDLEGRKSSIARRDGWLRSAADGVIFMTDGTDTEVEDSLRRWDRALGDDVWRLDTPTHCRPALVAPDVRSCEGRGFRYAQREVAGRCFG